MKLAVQIAAAVAVTSTALVAQFDQDDYFASAPFTENPGIYRIDAETGVATPFAVPLGVPHYGWFGNDGDFYVPDRGVPALLRIEPDGTAHIHASGPDIVLPVTCIPNMADDAWILSDMGSHKIMEVGYDGSVTVLHDQVSTGGLIDAPDGLAFDDDGNLYVANLGTDTIVKIDPQGVATEFASDQDLIRAPGAIAIDGAGNLFVTSYDLHIVARFRLDTGEGEVFAGPDISKMVRPNDLKLSRDGGLVVAGRVGRINRVDALGNIVVESETPELSEYDGVSVAGDATLCSGRYEMYGVGTPGSGGVVPQMRAIFSPCSGHTIALEFRDFVGGAPAMLFVGGAELAPGAASIKGLPLLVDPSAPPFLSIPLFFPGTGPGTGDLTLQFDVPVMTGLDGLELYHQVFASDPGVPKGLSSSNGLKETFGL